MTTPTLRLPVSTAARKGVSAVAAAAADHRIVLTSLGRPVAVVDAAERLDEDLRRLREGARTVVEAYATLAADREAGLTLAEVCAQLGLDETAVREHAERLRERA
jgi:PHD/YefM family antitoxin component YafN of YafNO toxin-antitoxin module